MSEARQTAGWAAGVLCDRSAFGLAPETELGIPRAGDYQQIRLSSATLALSQDRVYPEERNPRAERAIGVPSRFSGSGTLDGLLSFGNQDALMEGVLGNVWQNGTISNGIERKSWTLRQRLGDGWLCRTGMFMRSLTLSASQGGFAQLSCDVLYCQEAVIPSDEAAVDNPAPSRSPFHPCASRLTLTLPGMVDPGILRSVSLAFGRQNAALDHGAGSPFANDVRPGLFSASGKVEVMLRSHEAYDALRTSGGGPLCLSIIGLDGYGYEFTFHQAQICNPRLDASGRNTIIMASFDIEAMPGDLSNGTVSVSIVRPIDYRIITVDDDPILNNNQKISP